MGMGMPHHIRDLEIPEADLPVIAAETLGDWGSVNNAVPVTTVEQVMEVLRNAY